MSVGGKMRQILLPFSLIKLAYFRCGMFTLDLCSYLLEILMMLIQRLDNADWLCNTQSRVLQADLDYIRN